MKENQRKCFKCWRSPANDKKVKLFRFPRPGITNSLRCESWAKYCFPEKTTTVEFQKRLYSEHKMLCEQHFKPTSFVDFEKKTLHRFAVPEDVMRVVLKVPNNSDSSVALQSNRSPTSMKGEEMTAVGPSQSLLGEKTNFFYIKGAPSSKTGTQDKEKADVKNDSESPSPSAAEQNGFGVNIVKTNEYEDIGIETEDVVKSLNEFDAIKNDSVCDMTCESEVAYDDNIEYIGQTQLYPDPQHWDCVCNICEEPIIGFRYTCLQCADWDMCAACEARGAHLHHYVLRLPAPTERTDGQHVIKAVSKLLQDLLIVKKEIEEIYFKEEVNDEMAESFTQDMTDPLPEGHETHVLDMMFQEDSEYQDQTDTETMSASVTQSRTNAKSDVEFTNLKDRSVREYFEQSEVPKTVSVQNPCVPKIKPKRLILRGCIVPDESVTKASTSVLPSKPTVLHSSNLVVPSKSTVLHSPNLAVPSKTTVRYSLSVVRNRGKETDKHVIIQFKK